MNLAYSSIGAIVTHAIVSLDIMKLASKNRTKRTIRLFRVIDGNMIVNYRLGAEASVIDSKAFSIS